MKEIVVIFVRAQDVNLPVGESPGAAKTDHAAESIVDNDSAPPFWTWFIENPRPRFSSSISNLAGLNLARRGA